MSCIATNRWHLWLFVYHYRPSHRAKRWYSLKHNFHQFNRGIHNFEYISHIDFICRKHFFLYTRMHFVIHLEHLKSRYISNIIKHLLKYIDKGNDFYSFKITLINVNALDDRAQTSLLRSLSRRCRRWRRRLRQKEKERSDAIRNSTKLRGSLTTDGIWTTTHQEVLCASPLHTQTHIYMHTRDLRGH